MNAEELLLFLAKFVESDNEIRKEFYNYVDSCSEDEDEIAGLIDYVIKWKN